MNLSNERRFSTGEFAKLCKTTKETLFHYDQIGILKPAYVVENGYRYYTSPQFFEFDLIRVLKQAGTSLDEIGQFLNQCDPQVFLDILREKQQVIRQKRRHLEQMEEMLSHTIAYTERTLNTVYDQPTLVWEEAEPLLALSTGPWGSSSTDEAAQYISRHLALCEQYQLLERFPMGYIILKEDFQQEEFPARFLFSRASQGMEGPDILMKPAGRYATMTRQGSYETFPQSCALLLDFIHQQGLEILGNAYVYDLVSNLALENDDHFVLKISILVS